METAHVLFQDSSPYCLGNILEYLGRGVQSREVPEDSKQKNIEALLGVFEDDLLNGGKFYKELLRYARQKTQDFQLAEDAIANFYCNAVRKIRDGILPYRYNVEREKGIEGNKRIKPWAYACINNMCIDLIRKSRRHKKVSLDQMNSTKAGDEDGECCYENILEAPYEKTVEDNENSEIIRSSLSMLPESSMQVIELVYFQGLKYNEAAKVLGIPEGTVKSRMHSALGHLRESQLIRKLNKSA